jgi:predicted KAP-like P-loop ATPase
MQTELPRIHVWQDNETEIDLLGFDVHANLIRSVITDPSVLPVTVGVFGDWGGGKSSIMKMLQKELSDEKAYPDVVCLYFNGWTFEGYEDA